ncbi:MAG: hypothetical protein IH891_10945 [Planctomycetes bacterium]|nr:hypothetical protein [Planctomycetota bacterium]
MPENFQMLNAAFQQLVAAFACCLNTEQQWISCLVKARIGTGGFANDMSAFRDGLADGAAGVTDEEIQEFIDQLRSRYGEFSSTEFHPSQSAPTAFGQPIILYTYLLHFSDSTVTADVEIVIADPQTDQFVMKLGVMTIRDSENGDLSFPPLVSDQNPDDSSDANVPDETDGG